MTEMIILKDQDRPRRLKLEELQQTQFKVLDHGFVRLVDVLGSDEAIEASARVSYQQGTRKINETKGLLRYLMRNAHTSPFEAAVLKFHIKLPIFVERQWVRHRTFSHNEVSARYSELPEEYYVPERDAVRAQSSFNKQGRDAVMENEIVEDFLVSAKACAQDEFRLYKKRLEDGTARELARINLPLSTYTEKIWLGNLHNLFHFLKLRMDAHAQMEIRAYANIIGNEIVAPLFPISWAAFQDYRLNAMSLSALDIEVVRQLSIIDLETKEWNEQLVATIIENGREREECKQKLIRMGLIN